MQLEPVALAEAVVYDDEFDLHFFRQDVLDVNTHSLAGVKILAALGQPGQIRRDLDEGSVFFHAAHDAHHRFAHGKTGGVLGPGAQQLPDGQDEPSLHIPALDDAQDLLPHADPVGGGGDAADRHAVDGEQGADAASYVAESSERFDVGHGAGQDVAGAEGVEVVCLAHPLRLGAGEPIAGLAGLIGVQFFDDETGGPTHPREHGNVPHTARLGSVGTLLKGHHGPHPAQFEPQLAGRVERQCSALQNFAAGHGRPQLRSRKPVCTAVISFGTISLHHSSFLFLCCFCLAHPPFCLAAVKPYALTIAFYTSLDYTISVCGGQCKIGAGRDTGLCRRAQAGGRAVHGYRSWRYHPHPQKAPLRSVQLRGAAGGHGFQDPLHGLRPRGHAAPRKDRKKHQKGPEARCRRVTNRYIP